jgi:hypothetical protein
MATPFTKHRMMEVLISKAFGFAMGLFLKSKTGSCTIKGLSKMVTVTQTKQEFPMSM